MKIGILTYHRAQNYGALLQAIAMRLVLTSLGHDVSYVDYYPKYHRRLYKPLSVDDLRSGGIRYKIGYLLTYFARKRRYDVFERFVRHNIAPYCRPMFDSYDAVVYGSDQIWRKQPFRGDYNAVYFSINLIRTSRHIAYAASMGRTDVSEYDKTRLSVWLRRFEAIGVREDDLLALVHELGRDDAVKTIDPTLLLTKEAWDEIVPERKVVARKYLLLYELRNGFIEENVRMFASQRGLEVVKLAEPKSAKPGNARLYDDPFDFVNLIRNAEFVCTSSFHGLVFSIIYGRPFYTAFSSNADRARSLLEMLGLDRYLIEPCMRELPEYQPYDGNDVTSKLQTLRESSYEFLHNI